MGTATTVRSTLPAIAEREIQRWKFQGMFTLIHYHTQIREIGLDRISVVKNGKELASLPAPPGLRTEQILAFAKAVASACGVEEG